jgi:hypothetical protein
VSERGGKVGAVFFDELWILRIDLMRFYVLRYLERFSTQSPCSQQ